MAFDPDAFIADTTAASGGAFDPDEFIGTSQPTDQEATDTFVKGAKKNAARAAGAGEAALGMLAPIPSTIAGGVYGLGTLLSGQGLDKANEALERVQRWNFGAGAYEPSTEKGKEYSAKAEEILAMPGEAAGRGLESIAPEKYKNIAYLTGKLPVDVAMELLEPGVLYAGAKGMASRKKGTKTPEETPVSEILKEDVAKPFDVDEFIGPEQPGPYSPLPEDLGMWRRRAEVLQHDAMREQNLADRSQAAAEAPPPVLRAEMAQPHLEQQGVAVGTPEQMEGLRRSTEGVTFENIPPDAVIPRDAPRAGLETPTRGQWVVDENGIPVRENFAPEARLGPPMDIPIREGANDLGNAIQEASGPRLGADDIYGSERLAGPMGAPALPDTGPPSKVIRNARGQAGRINLDIFDPRFDQVKRLDDRYMLRFRGPQGRTRPEPTVFLIDKQGTNGPEVVGSVIWGRDKWSQMPDMEHNLEALMTQVDPAHQRKGLAEAMYRFANEQGNDIVPSEGKQTPEGKAMWEGFRKRGYTGRIETGINKGMKRGQGGGVDFDAIAEAFKGLRGRWPQSVVQTPEEIMSRQQERAKAKVLTTTLGAKIPEYLDPKSVEEAAQVAINAKDINSNPYTRGMAPGNNFMATYHNNPLLKYARRLFNDARANQGAFERAYVTGDTGTLTLSNRLNDADVLRLNETLMFLEKNGMDYTPEIGAKVGLSENAKAFADAWNRGKEAAWQESVKNHASQGVKDATKLPGYLPAMTEGSYFSMVMVGDRPVGYIMAETPGEFFKAKKYYEGKHAGAKFSHDTPAGARIPIGTGGAQNWKFRDLSEMITLLTNADNSFGKLQMEAGKSALKEAVTARGFNVHNMEKTGLPGSLGNKPWLDAKRNASDRINSINRFLSQSAEYNSLQHPVEELRTAMTMPEFEHMPQARAYLDDYISNALGQYKHGVGKAVNEIFDVVSKVPEMIPGLNKVYGPRRALKAGNAVRNRLAGMYMGWFNAPFMGSQLLQPMQTGAPLGMMYAGRLGLSDTQMMESVKSGYANFVKSDLYDTGVLKTLDPEIKEAADFAKNQGMMQFTEAEKAYAGSSGKVSRGIDTAQDLTMKWGEHASRVPVFFSFYDMLRKGGADTATAKDVAVLWTNEAMGDYHPNERPLMYTGMGVMAGQTGALTTFKHRYAANQVLMAKEFKTNPKPIVASVLISLALAGITGTIGYDDADAIYQTIRGATTGEKRSIRQDVLSTLPEWSKTGLASAATGLNVQSKFETSQLAAGGDIGKLAAPYASGAIDIAKDVGAAVMDPSRTNLANAAVTASPVSIKQAVKAAVQRDQEGYLLNRYGQRDVHRTPEDWRKSAASGLTPISEAVQKENLFQNRQNEKFRNEKLKEVSQKFKQAVIDQRGDVQAELLNEYEELGGDPITLIRGIPITEREAEMTSQERAEGIPRSRQGIGRYERFQTE